MSARCDILCSCSKMLAFAFFHFSFVRKSVSFDLQIISNQRGGDRARGELFFPQSKQKVKNKL